MEASQLDMALQALQTLMEPHRLMILVFGVLLGLAIGVHAGTGRRGRLGGVDSVHLQHGAAVGLRTSAGRRGRHDDIGPDTGRVVRGARHGRRRGNDHGRSRDGRTRRGGPRLRRGIRRGRTRRRLRRDRARRLAFRCCSRSCSPSDRRSCSAFSIFGLSMVATLSGRAPLKGLTAAGLGLMISMVGAGTQTGTLRWTFDWLYLFDGIPLIPVTLGLFALPELADLAINRRKIIANKTARCERLEPMGGREGRLPALVAVPQMQRHGHAARRDTRASVRRSSTGSSTATPSAARRARIRPSVTATCAA